MGGWTNGVRTIRAGVPPKGAARGISVAWLILASLALVLPLGAVAARLLSGPLLDELLMIAAGAVAAVIALRLLVPAADAPEAATEPASSPLKDVLDSAGPMVMTAGLDGR